MRKYYTFSIIDVFVFILFNYFSYYTEQIFEMQYSFFTNLFVP